MAFVQVQPIRRQLKGQNRLIKVPPPNKTKLAMESSSSNGSNVPLPASQHPLHVTDADEEDKSVKQLNECATIYLSLQVLSPFPTTGPFPSTSRSFPSISILGLSDLDLIIICLQDCLIESNRNWKVCQACRSSYLQYLF